MAGSSLINSSVLIAPTNVLAEGSEQTSPDESALLTPELVEANLLADIHLLVEAQLGACKIVYSFRDWKRLDVVGRGRVEKSFLPRIRYLFAVGFIRFRSTADIRKFESRPISLTLRDGTLPAVRLAELLDEREAQSDAIGFRGEPRLSHVF